MKKMIDRQTSKKAIKAAFALATLGVFVCSTVATPALQAQTESSSDRPLIIHNMWSSGPAIPTPVAFATAGVLNGQIYVVGGYPGQNYSGAVGDTQVYNPTTKRWSSTTALPQGTAQAAAAVVKGVLYVIGGSNDGGVTLFNNVWAYSPKTKTWTSKAAMPTPRASIAATVENYIIYVVGGYGNGQRLNTVEAYNPATNSWTEEAPLLTGKSEPSVGLIGNKTIGFTIVAADGYDGTSDNGDNEGYNASANTWTSLKFDPNPRNGACGGVIGTKLYVAGGGNTNGPALSSTESYKLSANAWATLASIPQITAAPASAVYKGQLYCIGGWNAVPDGTLLNNMQIYQP